MTTLETKYTLKTTVLYIGIELSASKWLLSFRTGFAKCRNKTISSWDIVNLAVTVKDMKKRFGLESSAEVKSCYEAGQDGFSVHRQLEQLGIKNIVVDSASIETSRRKKRLKTDRIDGEKLSAMLLRYDSGDKDLWRVARVPTETDEDLRRTHREMERLQKEAVSHQNRIRMLLKTHGIKVKKVGGRKWKEVLEHLRTWDNNPVPERLLGELKRESERLLFAKKQIKEIEDYQLKQVKESNLPVMKKVTQIKRLKGIGMKSAWILVMEWFGWRKFNNVKEVGAAAGLVGVRRASGEMSQDQGISKVGSPQIRTLMIELAWSWLRYQPNHPLSKWFKERFSQGARLKGGDDLETCSYLILDHPIDVVKTSHDEDQATEMERNLKVIQITGGNNNWSDKYIGKHVHVIGILFHRDFAHQHTSVLIEATHLAVTNKVNYKPVSGHFSISTSQVGSIYHL